MTDWRDTMRDSVYDERMFCLICYDVFKRNNDHFQARGFLAVEYVIAESQAKAHATIRMHIDYRWNEPPEIMRVLWSRQ